MSAVESDDRELPGGGRARSRHYSYDRWLWPLPVGILCRGAAANLGRFGFHLDMVVIETPLENPSRLARDAAKILGRGKLSRVPRALILAWEKLKACESLEKTALRVRPKEEKPGLTTRVLELALQKVRQAAAVRTVHKAVQEGIGELWAVQEKHGRQDPIIIGLVGEIYTVFEPFVNLRLEERLGHLGVEVARTISLVQWVKDHVFKGSIGLYRTTHLERSAEGFLSGFVGGHGLETIARSNELANCGAAGVVQILPFTCMPEVIAQAILPDVSRAKELPILSLVVDEHTGEAGFQTRIEAFVDLLSRKRRRRTVGKHKAYLGVDVGSVSTNLVLIDPETDRVLTKLYLRTNGDPIGTVVKGMQKLAEAGEWEVVGVGTTGSGRQLAGVMLGADVVKNEITAHAVAALKHNPKVSTVIEIGGQDSKIILIRSGVVSDFAMNTICAAGTGSFLDQQAMRLGIDIRDFGRIALQARHPVRIAGRCTVFAESDMIHKQQLGHSIPDILAGLCEAMVRNYLSNVGKGKSIEPAVLFREGWPPIRECGKPWRKP